MGEIAHIVTLAKPAASAALSGFSLPFVKALRVTLERERDHA